MASRRPFKLSYRLRLFIPVVGMMWLIIGGLVMYHYKREVRYRTDSLNNQLSLINSRIIDAYERGDSMSVYMPFIERYLDNSDIEEAIVAIYDQDNNLLYSIGDVGHLNFSDLGSSVGTVRSDHDGQSRIYYYAPLTSADGRRTVHIALPYRVSISEAIRSEASFWFLIVGMAIAVTLMAYYSTKYLTRNVRMLRDFANDIEHNQISKDAILDFPHDELGDVSRRLVRLYREKDDAIARSSREHNIAINAIREQERVKRQLTNNINHELKTPIGVIRGYLDTICDTPDLDDATRNRFLDRARDNITRLCSLLDDVSTMTRLEENGSNLPMSEVNFHDIIYNIDNELPISHMAGSLTFSYSLPINCRVKGNQNLLTAMISNLIKNAAIHSHGTEICLRLIIESADYYSFAFYDNGVGVKDENLPKLFERFYREDTGRSRKVGGTGLGLSIVKNTVEAHGGTISVHNRSTGGLEFHFSLEKWKQRPDNANHA